MDIDFLKLLSSHLGFTWHIKLEKTWVGVDPKTGRYFGSIGSVIANKSELAIGHFTPTLFGSRAGLYERAVRGGAMHTLGSGRVPGCKIGVIIQK